MGAAAGDVIALGRDVVTGNGGRALAEPIETVDSAARGLPHIEFGSYRVGDGDVRLIGDSSCHSWDSGYCGPARPTAVIEGPMIGFFGSRPVSSIDSEDVEAFIADVKKRPGARKPPEGEPPKRLSNRRTNMILQVLRLCPDPVVKKGWLRSNPAREVKRLREERTRIDPLSVDEVRLFLTKGLEDEEQRRYFQVAFFSGLRPSEQIGLQWLNLDWHAEPPLIGVYLGITRRAGESTCRKRRARIERSRWCRWSSGRYENNERQRAPQQARVPEREGRRSRHHEPSRARVEAGTPACRAPIPADVPDATPLRNAGAPKRRADRVGLEAARPRKQ